MKMNGRRQLTALDNLEAIMIALVQQTHTIKEASDGARLRQRRRRCESRGRRIEGFVIMSSRM